MVGAVAFAIRFVIPFAVKQVARLPASPTQRQAEAMLATMGTGATVISTFLIIYVFVWLVRFMWARITQWVEPAPDVLWD
jgi:hypothetical protein